MRRAVFLFVGFGIILQGSASLGLTVQKYSLVELGQHNKPQDCWIAIDGQVYDISSATTDHLRYKYALDPWCGKDSSQAWKTKDGRNKSHSRKAKLLLNEYKVGELLAKRAGVLSLPGR